jgi:hypothetical protein
MRPPCTHAPIRNVPAAELDDEVPQHDHAFRWIGDVLIEPEHREIDLADSL